MGREDIPVRVGGSTEIVEPARIGHLRVYSRKIEIREIVIALAEPAKQIVAQPHIEAKTGRDAIIVLQIESPIIIGLPGSMVGAAAGALIDRAQLKLS